MAQIALRNCQFVLLGGTPLFSQHTLHIGNGNLTYEEKRQMVYIKDKGILSGVRQGEDEPIDVKFDFNWVFLVSASGDVELPSIEEIIKGTGAAVGVVTTTGNDPCEPYCIDILIKNIVNCGTTYNEWITLKEFRWETLNHDPKNGQVACSGKCKTVSPIILRTLSS